MREVARLYGIVPKAVGDSGSGSGSGISIGGPAESTKNDVTIVDASSTWTSLCFPVLSNIVEFAIKNGKIRSALISISILHLYIYHCYYCDHPNDFLKKC